MSDIAIRVENLGKKYTIGANQARYQTVRESLTNAFHQSFRTIKGQKSPEENTIWALKDVNFEVKHGEVLGIIGRNGAGKSTLLKILARITKPTTGRIELNGRVGSLLEVGTGFHPELTGRENIYLSGAILGMKRKEIIRKFDEIVAFAETEKFLDTPVKHYSSGMYMRLAFSVAAHLEPEILLVDEVLAVGDAEFQKKCLGKMGDVAKEGKTIFLVSHNMSAIVTLCNRTQIFENGFLKADGKTDTIINKYLRNSNLKYEITRSIVNNPKKLIIQKACLLKNDELSFSFNNSDTLKIQIHLRILDPIIDAQIAFDFINDQEDCIFCSSNQDYYKQKTNFLVGHYILECPIQLSLFREGIYKIKISSSIPNVEMLDILDEVLSFQIFDDSSPMSFFGQKRNGIVLPIFKWKSEGPI